MRRLIAFLAITSALALRSVAWAESPQVRCVEVETFGGETVGQCSADGNASATNQPRSKRRPIELITAVSSTPETGACTILATPTSGQGAQAVAFQNALARINNAFDFVLRQGLLNELWAGLVARLPGCPSVSPPAIAFAFVREIIPPGPDPWIAPGYALTGKPSFVETRMPTSTPQRYDTPLGPLDVILRATTVAVDWGDGTGADEGPFPSPSKPWPHGKATHTFTVMGAYDVVVTQVWDADWRLAGQAGTVPGLTSVGRLDDFEARQLQAVRNR